MKDTSEGTRKIDVLIYGATGYTGQLVAEHFARYYAHDPELTWGLAGRNLEKLSAACDRIGAKVIATTPDGFNYIQRSDFPKYFAADLTREQAVFEAQSQVLTEVSVFDGIITAPAWRSKPSWMLVPTEDKIINPDLERFYANRAHSHVAEAQGASHSVYESRPKQVAEMIEKMRRSIHCHSFAVSALLMTSWQDLLGGEAWDYA